MFILEGNIGAGKSTFIHFLGTLCPSIKTAKEPLNQWDSGDKRGSLLSVFYENPRRWSFTMETFTLMCRYQDHQDFCSMNEHALLAERSLFSGHYVFALNGYEQGFFEPAEWAVYNTFFSYFVVNRCLVPQGFVYLRTDPTTAFERVRLRGRQAESPIPLEYLKQLHERHENFLINKQGVYQALARVPVLVVDGDIDFEHDTKRARILCEEVAHFIETNKKSGV